MPRTKYKSLTLTAELTRYNCHCSIRREHDSRQWHSARAGIKNLVDGIMRWEERYKYLESNDLNLNKLLATDKLTTSSINLLCGDKGKRTEWNSFATRNAWVSDKPGSSPCTILSYALKNRMLIYFWTEDTVGMSHQSALASESEHELDGKLFIFVAPKA